MDTIKLTPEDSGNLEQIAISIQKIEKILETLTKHKTQKNQSVNMSEIVEGYIVNEIAKGKKHKDWIGRAD